MKPYVLGAVLMIGQQLAAEDLGFHEEVLEDCLNSTTGNVLECVGEGGRACIEANGGDYSNSSVGFCMNEELLWWDARLNDLYPLVRQQSEDMDKENGDVPLSQAETLLAMQRAWIAFRDSKCAFEEAQWGGGTGAGPAWTICMLHATAEQVIYLETAKID